MALHLVARIDPVVKLIDAHVAHLATSQRLLTPSERVITHGSRLNNLQFAIINLQFAILLLSVRPGSSHAAGQRSPSALR
jgi:hypothetical protein